jgi:hypothetical protein
VGRIRNATGSYTGGLLSLSAVGLVAMVIVIRSRMTGRLERRRIDDCRLIAD